MDRRWFTKKNKSCLHDNGSHELHCDDNFATKPSSNLNNFALSDSSSSHRLDGCRRMLASPAKIIHQATTNKASFPLHPLTHVHSPEWPSIHETLYDPPEKSVRPPEIMDMMATMVPRLSTLHVNSMYLPMEPPRSTSLDFQ